MIISSRKESNVRNAVDQLKSEGIIADGCVAHVGIDDDRQKLIQFAIDRYRKIDILVSNAAVNPYVGDIIDITDSHWHKLFDVNVRSAFLLSKVSQCCYLMIRCALFRQRLHIWRRRAMATSCSCHRSLRIHQSTASVFTV